MDDPLLIRVEASNLLADRMQERYDVELVRGHRWMDSWHVRISPSEDIFILLKHAIEQFQFIRHKKRASIGNLIYAM